jgi:hypothetical protein
VVEQVIWKVGMVQDIDEVGVVVVLEEVGWVKVKFARGVYSGTHSQPWMGMNGCAVCAET